MLFDKTKISICDNFDKIKHGNNRQTDRKQKIKEFIKKKN